ncbi:hypothetical protein EJ05DRAFT_495451 [Pseudovirgaria hyperparasitica]|uniref:Defective in cullin neddylation protein n=1 Tax=Pseudovirgaria hyperparasitica TaxID=470096 RepID=A0A6A6WK84_9PEZI|nr:uncharacterized protein EJ05DRAFT_495451 [Pseudovirgaria hyperparasitica]KAF2762572.1 hypothetical protein EJ05DRAFT_495451 [Pseudovirgaria hyperparasitica]
MLPTSPTSLDFLELNHQPNRKTDKMPAAYKAAEKAVIYKFVEITQADQKTAAKILKSHGWNVDSALNAYDLSSLINTLRFAYLSSSTAPQNSVLRSNLNTQFDALRDEPREYPDTIKIDGSMAYFQQLAVDLAGIEMLVVSELLNCPTIGEITREGFIDGWSKVGADTVSKQKTRITKIMKSLPSDHTTFTLVYKHTFPLGRADGKKALQLENATEFWRILFSSPSSPVRWSTPTTPWLDWWIAYLEAEHKKDVNKDLWDQTLKFAEECLKDEKLDWWDSENSAWPGVIDGFVERVYEKRPKDATADQEGDEMDYD